MLKVTLTNLDTTESLDLDEIAQNGEGVEAVAGMTGLGLPPVDVQWFEGAGDGARARSSRALSRVLDVPLTSFTIQVGTESLIWNGHLNASETITVDAEASTVVDQDGNNRYAGLNPAPHFAAIAAGDVGCAITFASPAGPQTRINYVTNPSFRLAHDWTTSTPLKVSSAGGSLVVGDGTGLESDPRVSATKIFSGFSSEVGKRFQLRLLATAASHVHAITSPTVIVNPGAGAKSSVVYSGLYSPLSDTFSIVHDFIVPASGEITVMVTEGFGQIGGWGPYTPLSVTVDDIYIGLPGAYFDGATPDVPGVYDYTWTGTPDASTSTNTSAAMTSGARLTYHPRDWMAV